MTTKFYEGDVVIIQKGPNAFHRWNLEYMSNYIGQEATVSYSVDTFNPDRSDGDKRYKLTGLPGIGGWTWTGEDFLLKEKSRCLNCGDKIEDEGVIVNNKRMCSKCAEQFKRTCSCCGKEYYALSTSVVSGKTICKECFEIKTKTCMFCGKRYFKGEGYVDAYGNESCSADCRENYRMYNEEIMDYSEKPDPVFYGEKDELHLGVELEVDTKRDYCADRDEFVYDLSKVSGKHFCKYDGSLGEDGVEIVTQPCTLDYHMNSFNWEAILQTCREYGYYSDQVSTCGMHIHVDRSYFKNDVEAAVKLIYLINKFQENFINFSRRRGSALNDWAKIVNIENLSNIEDAYSLLSDRRYVALNVLNRNTLEFRLWKGSLNIETVMATMQMTQVLCDIVNEVEDIENITWVDICTYRDYNELKSYLLRRNLIRESELNGEEVA